ncbi:DUF3320 domain-containing protein [Amycolatopsis sp. EV170708-02-1]|uniref:DUF3320 domain-containing protein n=1 Tax=Amycolatopsis sp. EV170708-02-1 TaxID=2919322 RepID=UPI001F0BB7DE|nr:DUF3320 domain-containing protein [Amycolatopsis sp. EV170708-02-1]UMP01768.1 DUF3320 domain-containing protein [Amycolatopsis sp. EV170708-02-1]
MDKRVRAWLEKQRDELINMSRTNRLLYFKHTKTASLEVVTPGPEALLERLNRGSSGHWSFCLPAEEEEMPRPKPGELVIAGKQRAQILRALQLLERKAKQESDDKGLWVLHLGLGMLSWTESDDDDAVAVSPLILLPVTISRENLREPFRLRRTDDDPVLNPALAVKLQADFGISLPTVEEFEEVGIAGIMRSVERLVRKRHGWSVAERAVLTTFTFHKEAMYRDLQVNEDLLVENPMVQVLALGPDAPSAGDFDFPSIPEEQLEQYVEPETLVSVMNADASQRRCVIAARDGHSFVMDGPPGSGKSQTITNIIAELLHSGRTVLFVSEKAAALDVVYDRLRKANLADFALKLHSHDANRKAVAAELGRALAFRPTASGSFSATDRADLQRRRGELASYAQAMNEVRKPLGRSLHQVLGAIARLSSLPQAPVPVGFGASLSPSEFTRLVETAAALGRSWGPVVRGDDFLWRDLADTTMSASRRSEVVRMLDDARQSLDALEGLVGAVDEDLGLGWTAGPRDGQRMLGLMTLLDDRPAIPADWLSRRDLKPVKARMDELAKLTAEHADARATLTALVGPGADGLDPDHSAELEGALTALSEREPRWNVAEQADVDQLRGAARFLRASSGDLGSLGTDARNVAEILGLPKEGLSLDRAVELAALGSLADSPNRPEADWLNPAAQAALTQAADTLGELHREFHRRRDELRDVFRDEALALDLAGLNARFAKVHKGLGKLRRAYREDKRLLAECTVLGRVDEEVRSRLADAVSWKEAEQRLSTAEARHANTLGGHYYQRVDADFTRIANAIEVARQAVVLAGEKIGEQRIVRQLAREGAPDPQLSVVARRLEEAARAWLDDARVIAGPKTKQLRRTSIDRLLEWVEQVADLLDIVTEVVDRVGGAAGRPVSVPFAVRALRQVVKVRSLRERIEARLEEDRQLLGTGFRGVDTNWESMNEELAWAERVRAHLGGSVRLALAEAVLGTSFTSADIRVRQEAWTKCAARIAGGFTGRQAGVATESLNDDDFEYVRHFLVELADSVGDIDEWAAYATAREKLSEAGLGAVVSFCVERQVEAGQVRSIVERALSESWADDVLKTDAVRLGALRAADRDALVAEFGELDRAQIANASAAVINSCSGRRPNSNLGAAAILQREAQKQRRHMPIRDLLGKAGNVAQLLKPCFMMSPLAVSQYLPAALRFDAVIFDEASQVRPADAINCVYRGRQLVVAGDQKQLPPSNFFATADMVEDDTYDEDQVDEFESLLDLCKAAGALKSLPLSWHYRSQHESLITYSNYRFYDGKLLTFPGATEKAPDVGVELFKVDGVYRRGGARDNPVEAQKVIERVLYHRRHHPGRTLGVVTFSGAQQDAIERELEAQAERFPELAQLPGDDRLHGFFVKSLENVQGDERDIIIFSIGYGPDEHGKFTLNMGPLNKKDGWRRLNVAITRAQRRVEIISSVTPGQFVGNSSADGVRHLRGYLDFALRGVPALALELDDSGGDAESPFEEEVLRSIRSWGYDVVPQVGVAGYRIDLGVRGGESDGTYVLGVECDGAMYHSAKVTRDRDRLRQSVLEGLGWRIHRIWGTAWYRDRQGQEARLRRAIEAALAGEESGDAVVAALPAVPEVEHEEVDFDARPAWVVPYRAVELGAVTSPWQLHQPEARGRLRDLIRAVVQAEGPVHQDRVLRTIREAWGGQRSGPRIKEAFRLAVDEVVRDGFEMDGLGFLRARSKEMNTVRVPGADPVTQRDVKHLPREELRLAVSRLVDEVHSISDDELMSSVARLFGWQRVGPDIRAALEGVVEGLVRAGAMDRSHGHLESRGNA